jgi:adenosine 3'-phospho 5'-phosphosulfate transporter B3
MTTSASGGTTPTPQDNHNGHFDDIPNTPSKSVTRFISTNGGIMKIDDLPRPFQFVALGLCVFFWFGIHNILQEAMVNTEGFTFGVMLGWMEVLGVTIFSGLERSSIPFFGTGEARRPRSAPAMAYPPLTCCLLMSSSLASWSLNYINFPTKVVFRSCKLLPTMIIAYLMGNAKRFTYVEVGSAMAVCAGLITFAAGDRSLSNPQFHPFGLTLVSLSVFADAILPNAQEKLFRTYDASKSEVMFYTNIYTLVAQTCSALLSGDLVGMVHFVLGKPVLEYNYFSRFLEGGSNNTTTIITDELMTDDERGDNMIMDDSSPGAGEIKYTLICYMMIYILISHVAVSAHTSVVKKFGGVAAVFIGTARKGMTLILSFALFPKESNWRYPLGAILVLGGLTVASLDQQRNKHNNKSKLRGGSNNETIPVLPLDTDANNESHENNFDPRMSESRPLVNRDLELGRSSAGSTGNGPERRR